MFLLIFHKVEAYNAKKSIGEDIRCSRRSTGELFPVSMRDTAIVVSNSGF